MADIQTSIIPPKHILFEFEIAAYRARYDVTVDHRRVSLDMRVKDMARVHWANVQGCVSKYMPTLTPEEELAADWQFENDVTDAEIFGWNSTH